MIGDRLAVPYQAPESERKEWSVPHGSPELGCAVDRLRRLVAPPVTITDLPAGDRFERDVPVIVRDGTVLRANVFRPAPEGRYPVIMCAHPYGKDNLPRRGPFGYIPQAQFRLMRQSAPVGSSAWTSWEAPAPAFWAPRGYAVVNATCAASAGRRARASSCRMRRRRTTTT